MPIATIEGAARRRRKETDAEFLRLMAWGRQARLRGYFTHSEFIAVCKWKSGRLMTLCKGNTEKEVRAATRRALAATDERSRIQALIKLKGVAVPRASALLAAADPRRFGVIDIRAWQLLYTEGVVTRNPSGRGLSPSNWLEYLGIIRRVAKTVGTTPRLVEKALYKEHAERQRRAGLTLDGRPSQRSPAMATRMRCVVLPRGKGRVRRATLHRPEHHDAATLFG